MAEKYLMLEQNIPAARIFLNIFGFILETAEDINQFSKLKIFDLEKQEIGSLHFQDGKVMMLVNYHDNVLEASFDIAKIWGFVDVEGNPKTHHNAGLFAQWSSKITFHIQKIDHIQISGELSIASSADSSFGVTCRCHPLIQCEVPDKGTILIKMAREGYAFYSQFSSENYREEIDIDPDDWLNGFIRHVTYSGKYDSKTYSHEYERYAGIFNGAECGEDKNKLQVFLTEERNGNRISFHNELVKKAGSDDSNELFIQKGMLMQQLDQDMFQKIASLKKILMLHDISLLDNLVSVCYDIYTDEVVNALLGLERKPMCYQDGAISLVHSYFGIGSNRPFFPEEVQKRLIKIS